MMLVMNHQFFDEVSAKVLEVEENRVSCALLQDYILPLLERPSLISKVILDGIYIACSANSEVLVALKVLHVL